MYLMDFLDSGIFNDTLNEIINKICRLIYSVYFEQLFTRVQDQDDFWTWIKPFYSPLVGM